MMFTLEALKHSYQSEVVKCELYIPKGMRGICDVTRYQGDDMMIVEYLWNV